jgi:hypothetical protein
LVIPLRICSVRMSTARYFRDHISLFSSVAPGSSPVFRIFRLSLPRVFFNVGVRRFSSLHAVYIAFACYCVALRSNVVDAFCWFVIRCSFDIFLGPRCLRN